MSPNRLKEWLREHGEPVSIRAIEAERQKETGNFSERQIRKSMKALEAAGLVEYTLGEQSVKLWSLTNGK